MDQVERIWLRSEQVFGDKEKAAVWLRLPRVGFDGRSALELAGEEALGTPGSWRLWNGLPFHPKALKRHNKPDCLSM